MWKITRQLTDDHHLKKMALARLWSHLRHHRSRKNIKMTECGSVARQTSTVPDGPHWLITRSITDPVISQCRCEQSLRNILKKTFFNILCLFYFFAKSWVWLLPGDASCKSHSRQQTSRKEYVSGSTDWHRRICYGGNCMEILLPVIKRLPIIHRADPSV